MIAINLVLVFIFYKILRSKHSLSFFEGGRWWLTWLAVGIITLMDELTSIYYAPFEAYRFIGLKAIFYIALTSIVIRYLSNRMVEIADILEVNGIKGGGVYSFSYLVFGEKLSFIAVSSIMVDYVLTATLSTVSAVENGTSFLPMGIPVKLAMMIVVIWIIALLNISGIRENAKFTFYIFIFAAFVLMNLLAGAMFHIDADFTHKFSQSFTEFKGDFTGGSFTHMYSGLIIGIGSCILAYSGIESVLQTASLVKDWKVIKKGYLFLALTVGIVTPLIAMIALSSRIDITKHETDLIPAIAESINGKTFAVVVSILASVTLIMAVNTAMVASAELMEKVCERYNYLPLMKLNKRHSLYRIHILNGLFYTIILVLTSGNQAQLAEMYAVGLVASFAINTASLIKYRYSEGSKKISYKTSRVGTIILFIVLVSALAYIMVHRPYGTGMWAIITTFFLFAGIRIAKTRSPQLVRQRVTRTPLDIVFGIAESEANEVHLYFKRMKEGSSDAEKDGVLYITYYKPRLEEPEQKIGNYYWIAIPNRVSLFDMIRGTLQIIQYELGNEKLIHIHFGWPLSSWFDRLSAGTMIFNILRLPKLYPGFKFHIEY